MDLQADPIGCLRVSTGDSTVDQASDRCSIFPKVANVAIEMVLHRVWWYLYFVLRRFLKVRMGVSSNQGCHFGDPRNHDSSILGLILWSPDFGKLPSPSSLWWHLSTGLISLIVVYRQPFPGNWGRLMYHPYFSLPPGTAQCDG